MMDALRVRVGCAIASIAVKVLPKKYRSARFLHNAAKSGHIRGADS